MVRFRFLVIKNGDTFGTPIFCALRSTIFRKMHPIEPACPGLCQMKKTLPDSLYYNISSLP